MEKHFLQGCLEAGLSLEKIGELVDRAPSTVSYHLKKHGLVPVGRAAHAPIGKLDPQRLQNLVEEGHSLRVIAAELKVGYSTARYWCRKLGLRQQHMNHRQEVRKALAAGLRRVQLKCRRHGLTEFVLEGRGSYRCMRCRQERVAERRRVIKRRLVEDAGGSCTICGYDRCTAALHFHHVDPGSKSFALSRQGVTRSLEKARAEARKCVLLCSNCHAEVESGMTTVPAASVTVVV